MNNRSFKIASIVAGFVLMVGVIVILSQDLASHSGVSATYPLAGRTIAIPLYLWKDFSAQLENLLANVAQDERYNQQAESLSKLLEQIKPVSEP